MDVSFRKVFEGYRYAIEDLADKRTNNWWLVQTPGPVVTILSTYLFFCIYAGPLYMKKRKPYDLKTVIKLYNLFQIIINAYLTYRCADFVIANYRFECPNINYSDTPDGIREAGHVWWYFFTKVVELIETVIFVLRKKQNQVSFLHLYHHTVMTLLGWFAVKYYAGGQGVIDGGINSLVHVLMYGYYLLASLGSQYQKYLWWKKYLTALQMVQFSIVINLNAQCLLNENCNYSKFLSYFVIFNCFTFFYMFGVFYYKNYVNGNKMGKRN